MKWVIVLLISIVFSCYIDIDVLSALYKSKKEIKEKQKLTPERITDMIEKVNKHMILHFQIFGITFSILTMIEWYIANYLIDISVYPPVLSLVKLIELILNLLIPVCLLDLLFHYYILNDLYLKKENNNG